MNDKEYSEMTGWSIQQRDHLNYLIEQNATIAYWCCDAYDRPANGGKSSQSAFPGMIERIDGPLLLSSKALHATFAPHKWNGCKVWVVGLMGKVQRKDDEVGSLHREFVGLVYPEHCIDPSVGVRIGKKDLQSAYLQFADLQSTNLHLANLYSANLQVADLRFADLQSANLRFANLQFANLYSADLQFANLYSADLWSANLQSANLYSANLYSAGLQSTDLRFADLRSANLQSANLQFANLYSADLRSANLQSANLYSANLQSVDLDKALRYTSDHPIAGYVVEHGCLRKL
jgi:hypothetical protein